MSKRNLEPNKINEFTGINKIFKSKFIQYIFNSMYDGTITDFIEDWKWIFGYSKKYRWVIVFYLFLGILSSTLSLGSSVVSKYLIDIIVNKKISYLWLLAFLMIFSTVFSLLTSSILSRLSLKISIYVNNDIQSDIFDRMIDAEWSKINEYANGDLLNRFSNDIKTVANNAVNWIPNLIISIYTFIATFCIIMYYDVTMALISFLSAPLLLLLGRLILKKAQQYKKRIMEMNSQMMSFEVETFYNFDTIKSFGITDYYSNELKKWQTKYKDYNMEYNTFSIKTNIASTLLGTLVSGIAFGYCLFLLWTDKITYGTMTLFLSQRAKLSGNFNSLVGILPGMLNSSISAHRIREIVQLPKEKHDPEVAEKLNAIAKDGLTIKMDEVSFSYKEGKSIIENSQFIAKPNEIIAIVGPSGEGKTTMLRLILGLIHPENGRTVMVGSDNIEYDMNADLRHLFSYVPQGNTIISGTVADNLKMIKEDASDEEMIEALKIACAWEFVSKIDGQLYGKLGEKGRGLSEGQAQRIAIARAVLRNSPILLLDEATSALDVETERKVLNNIIKQAPNKTCIVSTHRPSVLSMCQRIYRVMDKKVVELSQEETKEMFKED